MATGQRVGYIRVSTVEQNSERQLDGVQLDRRFEDKLTGKDTKRVELQLMLQYVREGDTVIVHSMDRLARNLDDLRGLVKGMTDRGVRVEFVKEALTFSGDDSPISMLLLSVMGAFAEFERKLILERLREGVAIAKAAGKYKGRKAALNAVQASELTRRIGAGESKAKLAREYGVSRETVYNYAARVGTA